MTKYHTVALKIASWKVPALMTKGDGDNWHYGLQRQYFSSHKVEIVKDYGMIHIDDFDDIEISFCKEFYFPKIGLEDSCGWLSPYGTFYPCHSWEHDSKANTICKCILNFVSSNGTLELENRQWIRINEENTSVYNLDNGPTQKQIDALWDLYQLTKESKLQRHINLLIKNVY